MPRPPISGRRVRIRYMTQRKARPPTFALFGNQLDALPEAYLRYLQNGLRESFRPEGHAAALFDAQHARIPYDRERSRSRMPARAGDHFWKLISVSLRS